VSGARPYLPVGPAKSASRPASIRRVIPSPTGGGNGPVPCAMNAARRGRGTGSTANTAASGRSSRPEETPARPRAPGKMGAPIELTRAVASDGHARPEAARSPRPTGLGRSRSLARGETRVGLQRGRFACGASRACPEPARYQAGEGGPRKKPLHATPDRSASIGRSRPAFRFRRAGASESRGGLSRGGATSGTGRAQRPVGLRVDQGRARFWWFQ
jgi:hypothetical protein